MDMLFSKSHRVAMEYLGSPSIAYTTAYMKKAKPTKKCRPLKNVVEDDTMELVKEIKPAKIRKMYIAAFSSLLLALSMGLATGYSAPATYDMEFGSESSLRPTSNEITWIGSILALGAMIGGLIAGNLADKYGRKDALVFNLGPFGLGWLLIAFAKNVEMVISGRFFCGLACGVISVTVPMYCVEISTPEVRGILGSSFQGFMVIGNLVSVIVGATLSWRYLAVHAISIAVIGVIIFCFMPKSPRWLLAKGDLPSAISEMNRLQGGHADAAEECVAIYKDLQNQPKGKLSVKEYMYPTFYKPALITLMLMFFQQGSGANAVLFYSSRIFKTAKDFMDPETSTILLAVAQVVATLLSNLIVDKAGRKILLIVSAVLMALSLMVLGTFYYISSTDTTFQSKYSFIPIISLISFVVAFSIGFGAIPWLLSSEMVSVRARSTVSAIATFSNGLFAFIVTKTFSALQEGMKDHGTFWLYSSVSVAAAFFVYFFVPETKGKKLEDVEKLFQKKSHQRPENAKRSVNISIIA